MKKIFLVFVIILLLTSLIPVNCFAGTILPEIPDDGWEYWVIWDGNRLFKSSNPITVRKDKKRIIFNTYRNYSLKNNEWELNYTYTGTEEYWYDTIDQANHDIAYSDGSGIYKYANLFADVNFVTPPSGVQDTQSEMIFNISTEFNRLLTPDEIKNIDYEFFINDEKVNILQKLNEAFLPFSNKNRTSHILSFKCIVPIGENFCEIIYYDDEGIEIGYGSVEFERLAGFIDADGDGKDDRTGRTSGIRRSSDDIDSTIDKPIKPDDDATAIDWLKYLGEYVGYIFEVLLNSISNFAKNVVSGVGSVLSLAEPMFSFINQFFSSMPVEIRTGFIAMFSVSAFLVIMKMIRG